MSVDQGNAGNSRAKQCRICGKDLAQLPRVRDQFGRYRCPTCVDDQVPHAGVANPAPELPGTHPHSPPEHHDPHVTRHASNDDTPTEAPPAMGSTGFNPALAETKADMPALHDDPFADAPPQRPAWAPPPFPARRLDAEPVRDAGGDIGLAGEKPPEDQYVGPTGPRKRIEWGTAEDERREAEAEAAQQAAATPDAPGADATAKLDPHEIPEDRSGLWMRIRPGQLRLPAMLCVIGILGAAGLAFGISASPEKTMSAVTAAFNSGTSAAVQAALIVGIYALCCLIWIKQRVNFKLVAARLAAFSALMAMATIGMSLTPKAGAYLTWAVPLIGTVLALRWLAKLKWDDATYCGLLIFAAHWGVRLALDADLVAKTPLNSLK